MKIPIKARKKKMAKDEKLLVISDDCAQVSDCEYENSDIKSVVLGKNVFSIGKSAFGGCVSLSKIQLNEGLEYIDDWAFGGCAKLKEVKFPYSVLRIGKFAFCGCKRLT